MVKRIVREKDGTPIRLEMGSTLEQQLAWQIRCAKVEPPVREFRFSPPRRFRFDFAWPDRKLAVEVQGAVWTHGRHTRGSGAISDAEKLSLAAVQGWRVLVLCEPHIRSGVGLQWIEDALNTPEIANG